MAEPNQLQQIHHSASYPEEAKVASLQSRGPCAASRPERALLASRRIHWATDPFACGGYSFVRPGATGARLQLAAADTGALFWAGAATATPTIADTVQAAYLSGLRAAGQAQSLLAGSRLPLGYT
jgi:monoamine oxidase